MYHPKILLILFTILSVSYSNTTKLLLSLVVTDSEVTIGAKNGFLPSLHYTKVLPDSYTVCNKVDNDNLECLSLMDLVRDRLFKIKEKYINAQDINTIIIAMSIENTNPDLSLISYLYKVCKKVGFTNIPISLLSGGVLKLTNIIPQFFNCSFYFSSNDYEGNIFFSKRTENPVAGTYVQSISNIRNKKAFEVSGTFIQDGSRIKFTPLNSNNNITWQLLGGSESKPYIYIFYDPFLLGSDKIESIVLTADDSCLLVPANKAISTTDNKVVSIRSLQKDIEILHKINGKYLTSEEGSQIEYFDKYLGLSLIFNPGIMDAPIRKVIIGMSLNNVDAIILGLLYTYKIVEKLNNNNDYYNRYSKWSKNMQTGSILKIGNTKLTCKAKTDIFIAIWLELIDGN
jgi:hypothetical protein